MALSPLPILFLFLLSLPLSLPLIVSLFRFALLTGLVGVVETDEDVVAVTNLV
jgi:hypothetical protein